MDYTYEQYQMFFIHHCQQKFPEADYAYFINRLVPYETIVEMPLLSFNREQILDLYKFLNIPSLQLLQIYHQLYSGFVRATISISTNTSQPISQTIEAITEEDLTSCVSPYINNNLCITFDQIQGLIHILSNIDDKALVLSLFYGIDIDRMLEIQTQDIDVDQGTIHIRIESDTDNYSQTDYIVKMSYAHAYIIQQAYGRDKLLSESDATSDTKDNSNVITLSSDATEALSNYMHTVRVTLTNSRLNTMGKLLGVDGLNVDRLMRSGDIYRMQQYDDWELKRAQILELLSHPNIQHKPFEIPYLHDFVPRPDLPHTVDDFLNYYKDYID